MKKNKKKNKNKKKKQKPTSNVATPADRGEPQSRKVADRREANGTKEAVTKAPQDPAGAPEPQEKSPAAKSERPGWWRRWFGRGPSKKKPDADKAAQRTGKQPAGGPAVDRSGIAPSRQPKPPSEKAKEELSPELNDVLGLAHPVAEVKAPSSAGVRPTSGAPSDAAGKPGAPAEAQPPIPRSKGTEAKPAAEVKVPSSAGVRPTSGAPSDAAGKPGAPGKAQSPILGPKGTEAKPAAPSSVKEEPGLTPTTPAETKSQPAAKTKRLPFWRRLFRWGKSKEKPDADKAAQRTVKPAAGEPEVGRSDASTLPQPKPPTKKAKEKPPVAAVKAPADPKAKTAVLEDGALQETAGEKTAELPDVDAVPQPTEQAGISTHLDDQLADLSQTVKNLKTQLDKTSELTEQVHSLQSRFEALCDLLERLRGETSQLTDQSQTLQQEAAAARQLADQVRTLEQKTLEARVLADQFKICGQAFQRVLSLCGGSQNPGALVPAEAGAVATSTKPMVTVARLQKEACSKEKEGLAKDQTELDGHLQQMRHWREQVSALRKGLTSTCLSFADLTSKASKEAESLLNDVPEESQEGLKGRQKGMDVTAKMMRLSAERAEAALATGEEPSTELPVLGEEGWRGLVDGKTDRGSPVQTLQRKLKDLERKRFQVVTQVRNAGEKYRKSFRNFGEKHILPILDSIDDGEEHSRSLVEKLKAGKPEIAEDLDTWFQTYGNLRRQVLDVLGQVAIRPMEVEIGGPIDYHRHEPFDFEPDLEVKDEHIKSVTRKGYEYQVQEEGAEFLVLRPAQVIVVKNKKEQKVPNDAS